MLLCFVLTTSGCGAVSDAIRVLGDSLSQPMAQPTSPPKRASRIASPSSTPAQILPKTPRSPAQPVAGSGVPPPPQTDNRCPEVSQAVYEALEKPTALPPAQASLNVDQTKRWIGNLEGQVSELRGHLRETVTAYTVCRPTTGVAGTR